MHDPSQLSAATRNTIYTPAQCAVVIILYEKVFQPSIDEAGGRGFF
jgi:hypothetical protein